MEGSTQEENKSLGGPFADCHVHLQDYEDSEIERIMKESKENNVKFLACNATSEKDFDKVKQLSEQFPSILPGYGLHPWFLLSDNTDAWEKNLLDRLDKDKKAFVVIILGEIGLDYNRKIPKLKQKDVFERQFKIAFDQKRTANIHCVKAHKAMIEIMEKYLGPKDSGDSVMSLRMNIILHSYAGKEEDTKKLLGLNANFFFSFSLLAAKKEENFKNIPLENLLIETDSPHQMYEGLVAKYCTDWQFKKGAIRSANTDASHEDIILNEPKYLKAYLFFLSELYNIEIGKLTEILWKNCLRAFNIV